MKIVYIPIYISKSGERRQSPICYGSAEQAETLANDVLKNEPDYTSYEIKELWLG